MAIHEPLCGSLTGANVGTRTALGGAATYNSEQFQMAPRFGRIRGFVYADVAGTFNLQVQRAGSPTNYVTVQTFAVPALTGMLFDYVLPAGVCRIQYVNGAGAQAEFQLEAYGAQTP